MAAIINRIIQALDNFTTKQIGENGHVEYGWSNSLQEKIVQFSFQLTRTDENGIFRLEKLLNCMLNEIKNKIDNGSLPEKEVATGYLSILYRMIGQTRDIIDGKGEYTLAYMMVHTWSNFYPELAKFALRCFVTLDNPKVHQYGSWKDLKYFCGYCKEHGLTVDSPLIQYSIQLMNEQIKNDYQKLLEGEYSDISLAAKWAPREKSSFGWLYNAIAVHYFRDILDTAKNEESVRKATLKCKTEYRKLLSSLNKKIDTLQIKQCGNDWSSIDFNKVTSISLGKNKKSFLNINKNGEVRCPDNEDRIECAEHFNAHIQKAAKGEIEMKGKRLGMADFTKQALELLKYSSVVNQNERDLLNSQWRDNSSQNVALGKMIAMVDVSGSMNGDPMDVAIALGIRIAEKSLLGKRVMTFSSNPTWVNLEPYSDFISQVDVIRRAEWGMNTNFQAALDMILNAIIENKMEPEDVQDMVLVILSDMQMDSADSFSNKDTLYQLMAKKYADAGIRVNGTPYTPPHILFWNLRSTSGFPVLSNQTNTSMMSGFSPTILNLFCDKGLDSLQSCTPWSLLVKSLENERYNAMGDKLSQEI